MKFILLLTALLVLGLATAPAQAGAAEELASSNAPDCNGVVLGNKFTGSCSYGCYGEVFVNGNWFASWTC